MILSEQGACPRLLCAPPLGSARDRVLAKAASPAAALRIALDGKGVAKC